MPSGRTHLKIEIVALALWIAGAGLLLWNGAVSALQVTGFFFSYVFSMILMSPDLDLSTSRAFDRWGMLRGLWLPYAWLFKHRQASHHLLWGPLSRVLYLMGLGLGGLVLVLWATGRPVPQWKLSIRWVAPIGLGLYLPNLEHIVADQLSTGFRRKRRRHRL